MADRLTFCTNSYHTYTLEEVGRQFRVTRERIRQIEAKALKKMRHPTRIRQLHGFLELQNFEDQRPEALRQDPLAPVLKPQPRPEPPR